MKFRFGSWNVNARRLSNKHIEFLRAANCDLLAVQESTEAFHRELSKAELFDWSQSSLYFRPPLEEEGRARRLGCSIFGRACFALKSCGLLPDLHLPERAIVAQTLSGTKPLTVSCFHTPPGSTWGKIKPQTLKTIATWLGDHDNPLVVGIDANTPKTDHPNHEMNEWWWTDEPLLLGPTPLHKLRDAFRAYLAEQPMRLDEIRTVRPAGPLAISYVRGRGARKTDCRYDFILVSNEITVREVKYIFDKTLSDHALVIGNLERGLH
jgi:exonuclease III